MFVWDVATGEKVRELKPSPKYARALEFDASGRTLAISWTKGDNSGTFNDPVFYATGYNNVYGITLADTNGDGKADLVASNYDTGYTTLFLNKGDGYEHPKALKLPELPLVRRYVFPDKGQV